ncbi:MAG TPA: vitamin K epoxide reductase family protein [Sandaracinaceae bacterium]
MRRNLPLLLAAAAALAGLVFASFSTHDFVQHLDRQVHGLHCSFLPGLEEASAAGTSGCHVTLMSPYSSVLREAVWGGIPISLPAMAVFAFLLAFALFVVLADRQDDRRATGFFVAAWMLPVLASAVMGYIAFATLDAACKLCIGMYVASGVGLAAALAAFFVAPAPVGGAADDPKPAMSWGALAGAFALGVVFVLVPVAAYAATVPDFSRYVGSCGSLPDPSDPNDVLVPIGPQTRPVPVLEVLDPLCPACKNFEARFDASSVAEEASRRVLLFPLDDRCNWMVEDAIHPGACAISEAVLCAGRDAEEVIEWAFANQTAITEAARRDPDAAARMARQRFPSLAQCIGSPTVQAKLNQALRWAVRNQLPVLTPQVYVGDLRLCDADTDLGMDYALTRLVDRWRQSPHIRTAPEATAEASAGAPQRVGLPERNATEARAAGSAPSGPRITVTDPSTPATVAGGAPSTPDRGAEATPPVAPSAAEPPGEPAAAPRPAPEEAAAAEPETEAPAEPPPQAPAEPAPQAPVEPAPTTQEEP